jgi:Rhodopirellula transposase DDE domain
LTVRSELDSNTYPKGIKVADTDMDALNLQRHDFHGEWNYTIKPNSYSVR